MTKMRYMPATSPYTSPEQTGGLERLGRLRERRKAPRCHGSRLCQLAFRVSPCTGSRQATLGHIGAYINVMAALGLHLVVLILDAQQQNRRRIRSAITPGLRTWHGRPTPAPPSPRQRHQPLRTRLAMTPAEEALTDHEKAFIQHLAGHFHSNGRLLV